MPSEAEQYLYDHQWEFAYDWDVSGCASCCRSKPYEGDIWDGHAADCELAAILERAGFEVRYYLGPIQGPPTAEEQQRGQRFVELIRTGLGPTSALMQMHLERVARPEVLSALSGGTWNQVKLTRLTEEG